LSFPLKIFLSVYQKNVLNSTCCWHNRGGAMEIDGEFIKLDSFLKAVDAVSSGGEAKILIQDGLVTVNGDVEVRRGRKLRPGDLVCLAGREFKVE